ncbi:AAA family ATPase [Salinicola halophilus]|uniref:AAA family ATPase n=1 Tax=Salinicola halophilus TaxID=184065 RepID=UPI000DA154C6|nr:AAA family ATPase [Salinicola halophilus]
MKILAIRLENLASLAGQFELDFTTAPLADQGLFAITGPTGAGKSTLLDALCLALYGSTPRLRQAPTRDSQIGDVGDDTLTTADARTLLRRGCASGFAEVDFVGRDGERYRARWAVRRARGKVAGSLQKAEQSLAELDSGRILTAQKREFDRLLPERLGLNFEQFTRAVLLAQSEFAAFLKADDNARSELLERLTDTQHYSAISKAAYARVRDARAAQAAIDARLADALPVDAETRAELERDAQDRERELQAADAILTRHQAETTELEREATLRKAWQQAERARAAAEANWQAQTDERETLARLDAIAPWRDKALRRQTLARQLDARERELSAARDTLSRHDDDCAALAPERETARHARDEAERGYQADQPRLEEARQWLAARDRQQAQLEGQLEEQRQLSASNDEEARRQRELANALGELEDRIGAQQRARAQLDAEARDDASDEVPAAGDPAAGDPAVGDPAAGDPAAEDTAPLRARLDRSRDRARDAQETLHALARAWQTLATLETEDTTLETQIADDQARLTRLEREGLDAKAALEAAQARAAQVEAQVARGRAARSDEVERLRATLDDETPCPVCGGSEHPYRHAPPTRPDEAMIAAMERQEQTELDTQAAHVDAARERHQQLTVDWRSGRQGLTERQRQRETLAPRRQAAENALDRHHQAAALRAADDPQGWLEAAEHRAQRTLTQRSDWLARLDAIDQALAPLEHERQAQTLTLGKLEERQTLTRARLETLDAAIPELTRERDASAMALRERLDEHASVDGWQRALESRRQQAQQRFETLQSRFQQAEQAQARTRQQVEHLARRQQEDRHEFTELDDAWQAWRRAHPDFDDAELTRLLEWPEADHRQLRERCDNAERERTAAGITADERRQALIGQRRGLLAETEDAALASEASDETLDARLAAQRNAANELTARRQARQEARDTAQHALREDDRRREAQREGAREREAAEAEVNRWERLNGLIGSADGKRFRRIAQSYNLDRLLTHANEHLRALTPRYRLHRGGSELGILVVDGDMADEQRSVHSLSGGETFLVSLALALGLASMASHQLKIESLFIDEGFGSLDPTSLALAMDALDGLQAQGRRVGVISHVQEMHERIPLQIRVEPRGNGASRVVIAKH